MLFTHFGINENENVIEEELLLFSSFLIFSVFNLYSSEISIEVE
jgi:hypothetical protein